MVVAIGALGASAIGTFAPQPASACTAPVPVTVQLVSTSVPSDGVLAGVVHNCDGCSAADIVVSDDAGAPVPGRLEALPPALEELRWFAFRPNTPWAVGARYTVRGPAKPSAPVGTTAFTIVASSAADLRAVATLTTPARGLTSERCLEVDSALLGGFCGQPTFFSDSVVQAQLGVMLAEPAATQHAYRVVWSADGKQVGHEVRYQPGQLFAHTFEGAPSEVCYQLFALPLTATGSERALASECKRTDPSALGPRNARLGDVPGTLAYCVVPPVGYEREWCQILTTPGNSWCRPNGRMGKACARAQTECSKADAGEPQEPGASASDAGARSDAAQPTHDAATTGGATQGAVDAGTGSDSAAPSDMPFDHGSADDADDGGCSVRHSGRAGGSLVWLLMLALGWTRRRRPLV